MATQNSKAEQAGNQEAGGSQEKSPSTAHVLEFLRNPDLINMDMPLKTLFEQVETLQPDPSTGWGVVGDSGHLVLVWKGK